ncbi:MAG: SDR family NAD(P)-dependent oxidoreductase [Deltaproteobacteria bacterium]|nr:SDR family NAD(P)-dependent oxidoreductase [Deltaproteobacteria bacterium]
MPLDMSNFQYRGMGAYWTGRNLANGFGSATTADAVARAFAKHLAGQRVLVTGTDSGIGREAAKALATHGAEVWVASQTAEGAAATRAAILAEAPEASVVEAPGLELSDRQAVERFAANTLERLGSGGLHVLVNNAGVMLPNHRTTAEGLELHFAINYLGHWHLTNLLLPALERAAPSRIVIVSSHASRWAHSPARTRLASVETLNSPQWGRPSGSILYSDSKLYTALHCRALQRRLAGTGVTANALNPGFVPRTNIGTGSPRAIQYFTRALGALVGKSVPQGAATTVYAACAPTLEGESGLWLEDCNIFLPSNAGLDDEVAEILWGLSEQIWKPKE